MGSFLILCTGCASYQEYQTPLNNETAFSQSGQEALPDLWWLALENEELDNHINVALQNNFSLEAAWQRLKAAKALARRETADIYPELDVEAGARRTINGSREDQFTLGPAASYEVDLWGKIRASSNAENLRALSSQFAYQTAALSLSGDVAITWIRLIEAHNQVKLLKSQINTNNKALEVLKARFGIGQIRSEDILRQQLLIEAIKEEKIIVETDIKTLEHQLAVLRGETPQDKTYSIHDHLPVLPPLPNTGLPAELINRRPDIQATFFEMEAADKDLAAAVRDQYPSITLSASYISEAATAGNLFTDWITNIAGELVAPIFDGGERRAEVRRNEAVRNELLSSYSQNVLEAFQEVEDALIRETRQKNRIRNLEARLNLARKTYEQIQLGYFNGASEFISVLSAQTELQGIERDLLRARRDLIEFRIALYRALSGGFGMNKKENNKS